MKKYFLCLWLIVSTTAFCQAQSDSTPARADFAGIWFYSSGEEGGIQKQFPVGHAYGPRLGEVTASGLREEIPSSLEAPMRKALYDISKENGPALVDKMNRDPEANYINAAKGEGLIFACAINYEHTESQYMPTSSKPYSKVMAEVGYDLVICNFQDRRIMAVIPGRIITIDSTPGRASQATLNRMLTRIYENKLITDFVKKARVNYQSTMAAQTMGVGLMRVDAPALAAMPSNLKNAGAARYTAYFSSLLSSSFYTATNTPLLPYSGGNDKIFYVMTGMLADEAKIISSSLIDTAKEGEALRKEFLLKVPDYQLNIAIGGMESKVVSANAMFYQQASLAYSAVRLSKGETNLYVNKFQDGVSSNLPHEVKLSSNWMNYEDATIKMFQKIARTLSSNSKSKTAMKNCSIPNK